MLFVVSLLVWPVSTVSLFVLGYKSYSSKTLMDSFVLLLSQMNSAFIWISIACYMIGTFRLKINGSHSLSGPYASYKNDEVRDIFDTVMTLVPLNIFFYTWRFLATLEQE